MNSYASPSPVAHQDAKGDVRVIVHFGRYGTACLDGDTGETLWERRDLVVDHVVGPGASPALWEDLVVLSQDGADQQFLIALDVRTGATVWRRDRGIPLATFLDGNRKKSYSTPLIIPVGNDPLVVSVGAHVTIACDPRTGDERWRVRSFGYSQASRPVFGAGRVFVPTGYDHPSILAVDASGSGDVTQTPRVAWKHSRNVPTMSSPIYAAGRLYFNSEYGIVTCLDAESGERLGRRRVGGEYCASPILVGDRIYLVGRDGSCPVIGAEPDLPMLAENRLEDEFYASPVVVGTALFLRGRRALYRIEAR